MRSLLSISLFGFVIVTAALALPPTTSADRGRVTLPDLDDGTNDVIPANVSALAAVYFAAALDDLKLFSVADKIAQLFQQGELPGAADGGAIHPEPVRKYLANPASFPTPAERRRAADAARAFADALWARFAAALRTLVSERPSPEASRAAVAVIRGVLRAASAAGKAWVRRAAAFARSTAEALAILSTPDIQRAFGASDLGGLLRAMTKYVGEVPATPAAIGRITARRDVLDWLGRHRHGGLVPAGILGEIGKL
jgi:hypothetical protein